MCRNIKRLRRDDPPPSPDEIEGSARHLVRKLSGYQEPSAANKDVFEKAVAEVTRATEQILARLGAKVG